MPTWNSWYNPLDNIASAAKKVGMIAGLVADKAGTAAGLPDFGISEALGYGTGTPATNSNIGQNLISLTTPVPSSQNNNITTTAPDTSASVTGNGAKDLITSLLRTYTSKGNGSGGASGADLAYFDDQTNRYKSLLDQADQYLQQGQTNIQDSYNKQLTQANQDRSRALENFDTQRQDTTNAEQKALGTVDTNARTLADQVRRIIGLASGSGSSAYQFAAPGAVARDASQKRSNVVDTYATNWRDLATSENRAKSDFDQLLSDLETARKGQQSSLETSIGQQKQGILSTLADIALQRAQAQGAGYYVAKAAAAPYNTQYDAIGNGLLSLFDKYRTPVLDVAPVTVNAPALRDYAVDRTAANVASTGSANTGDPYAYLLKKKNEQ